MQLDSNLHSVFSLCYHLVLVVKYRKQAIESEISKRLKEIFEYIAPSYKITVIEWNQDKDHIHVLFKAHPKSEISKFVNAYKSASSRLVKKEYPEMRQKLWKECFARISEFNTKNLRAYADSLLILYLRRHLSEKLPLRSSEFRWRGHIAIAQS